MTGSDKTRDKLIFLYKSIMSALGNSGIEFILFYGSLLGIIRESNFIESDDDIDCLIDIKYYNKLINHINNHNQNCNEDHIITIKKNINNHNIVPLYINEIGPFDIYIFDIDSNNEVINIKWENESFRINDIFPLRKYNLHSHTIYLPKESEKIIEKTYGKDWRIPRKKQDKNYEYKYNSIIKENYSNNSIIKENYCYNKSIRYFFFIIIFLFILYILYKKYYGT